MTPTDQARVATLAARYGWSGIALTVWLLERQLDGQDVEDALDLVEEVHRLLAEGRHDPRERVWTDGHRPGFTLVAVPAEWGVGGLILPPVPGKATYTVVVPDPPPLPGP